MTPVDHGARSIISAPIFASGDPTLYAMLAGILLLLGATIGLGIAGLVLIFGKSPDKRLGRRFLACTLIPVVLAGGWWIAVVGFD